MENEESKDTFTFPSGTTSIVTDTIDLSSSYEYDYDITGAAGTDVITISEPDYSIDYTTMNSTLSTTTNTVVGPMGPPGPMGPMGPPGSAGTIYIGSGAIGGSTLTSTGIGGSTWTTTPTLSVAGYEHSATIQIGGKNPKLKTDETEIDINDLAGVVEAIKQIMDTNELPIFDRAFRDKHEILQKSWEDVKQAYENYRITEALLKSTPPGDDDDQ
jgi:hypothetical protein